ncbi:P-loop ATPase, Sll1717 family [Plantactinospora endophytica]|uniref:Orc1-like AAA ATPase domain-containing protein n=1 Tax=Plantactinospora endophytica TaxID=673535 RepID=A0ABQ4EGL0_9ACTN|nr:hypothetical protein [Plantactinospora endophytica]GIG93376.1 hypothetical protein Pen02_83120 [Plantactinospora endophytica]
MTDVSIAPHSDFDRLYFGKDDAESDAGSSGLLRAGFLRTAAFNMVMDGRKQLLIGRKGAGKSAICVVLADSAEAVASVVTPDEISADEIRQFELQGLTRQTAKQFIWRYVLAVQVAKLVLYHARETHSKQPPSVNQLRKFLLENGELNEDPRWHERFWKTIQRLRSSLSLEAFGVTASIGLGSATAPSEGIRISQQLDVVEEQLDFAIRDLRCPSGHGPFLVLVDQLEKVWSNDVNSDDMIIGLLTAAKHLAGRFRGVRCVVCIRSDIYDALQFFDRDKFRGDEMRIEWTPEALVNMLVARAEASLGSGDAASRLFGDYFTKTIDGRPTEAYLVERTLMRPRDLIQLANLCRDTAAKNGRRRVTEQDVIEAERQYSVWKVQDLANEYLINYPFLPELFVLFQNSGYIVTLAALDERVRTLSETLRGRHHRFASVFTTLGVASVLYGIGLIGVRRGDKFEYVHGRNSPLDGTEQEFCVHPCFRQALRATAAANITAYRPLAAWSPHSVGRTPSSWLGANATVRSDAAHVLFDALEEAGERAARVFDAAPISSELRVELLASLAAMLIDVRERANTSDSLELAVEQTHWVSQFFIRLANDLGADENLEVMAVRIDRIGRGLDELAHGLPRYGPRPSELS